MKTLIVIIAVVLTTVANCAFAILGMMFGYTIGKRAYEPAPKKSTYMYDSSKAASKAV